MLKHLYLLNIIPVIVFGQWVNFPIGTTCTNQDTYVVNTNCHPIMQVWSATVERVNILNNGGSYIPAPDFTNVYLCSAGSNMVVITNTFGTYSNFYRVETNVIVTNQFLPFAYSYSDLSGSHVSTGYPSVNQAMCSAIDTSINAMFPYFVATNYGTGYSFFVNWTSNKYVAGLLDIVPFESKGAMFKRLGMGQYTNVYTNRYGWEISTDGHFTKGKDTEFNVVLAETSYSPAGLFSNNWQLGQMSSGIPGTGGRIKEAYLYPHELGKYVSAFPFTEEIRGYWQYDYRYASTCTWETVHSIRTGDSQYIESLYKPFLRYQAAGTNAFTGLTVRVTGEYISNVCDEVSYPASILVNMTSTNQQLSNTWVFVRDLSIEGTSPNVNDTYVLLYTNVVTVYGGRNWFMNTRYYDERYHALNAMCYTKYISAVLGGNNGSNMPAAHHSLTGRVYIGQTEWHDPANIVGCLNQAQAAMENPANWAPTNETSYSHEYITINHEWDYDSTVADEWYYSVEIGGGVHIEDTYYDLTNLYTVAHDSHLYAWAENDANYYNFKEQFYTNNQYCHIESDTSGSTNARARATVQMWDYPYNYVSVPPSNVVYFQQMRGWFWLIDWSKGLKYK